MRFDWDPQKASTNERKHGVTFEEAKSVFWDEQGLLIEDRDHPSGEERLVLLGVSRYLRLLVVVHLALEADVIRIISARKATKKESRFYNERLR